MINKLLCFIVGHKKTISKCPVTGISLETCLRCSPKQHSTKMTFR
jgi:hypothetical protein